MPGPSTTRRYTFSIIAASVVKHSPKNMNISASPNQRSLNTWSNVYKLTLGLCISVTIPLQRCLIKNVMKTHRGRGVAPSFFTSALDGGGQFQAPAGLPPRKGPPIPIVLVRGWLGPGAGLHVEEQRNISVPVGNRTPAVQTVQLQ
jgi:hypothetical protein